MGFNFLDLVGKAAPIVGNLIAPGWGTAIGAGVGALAGAAGSKKSGTQQTVQQGVPSWLEPYWKTYLQDAQKLSGQPFPDYTGQRVADLSTPSLTGVDLTMQRAINGAPDLNAARGMSMDVTGGKYLNNPYLSNDYTNKVIGDNASQMARSFAEGTAAQNDAGFNRAGAYGGSAWANKQSSDAEALARQIGSMANQYQLGKTSLGVGDYRSGTGQMLQGGQLAGNLSQDDWVAAQMLGKAGNTLENHQQKVNDTSYEDFWKKVMWPYQQQQFLGGALGQTTNPFGNTTQTQPGISPWMGGFGGALVGSQIGGKIGGILDWGGKAAPMVGNLFAPGLGDYRWDGFSPGTGP